MRIKLFNKIQDVDGSSADAYCERILFKEAFRLCKVDHSSTGEVLFSVNHNNLRIDLITCRAHAVNMPAIIEAAIKMLK